MSERLPLRLTPEQNEEAVRLRQEHEDTAWRLRFANSIKESGRKDIQNTIRETQTIVDSHDDDIDPIENLEEHSTIQATNASLDKIVEEAQIAYDRNVARSRRHVDEHLPGYIAQATMEAREQGIDIESDLNDSTR